ncbi:MAG: hypothetical protein ACR2LG_03985 [Actinomycetota bacterium]
MVEIVPALRHPFRIQKEEEEELAALGSEAVGSLLVNTIDQRTAEQPHPDPCVGVTLYLGGRLCSSFWFWGFRFSILPSERLQHFQTVGICEMDCLERLLSKVTFCTKVSY